MTGNLNSLAPVRCRHSSACCGLISEATVLCFGRGSDLLCYGTFLLVLKRCTINEEHLVFVSYSGICSVAYVLCISDRRDFVDRYSSECAMCLPYGAKTGPQTASPTA